MAIFFIDGEEVTPEKFSNKIPNFNLHISSTRPLKFPKLSDHIEKILYGVDKHQEIHGRKNEEFPDNQKYKTASDYLKFLSGDFEPVPFCYDKNFDDFLKSGKKYNQNKPQMSRLFEQFPNALQMIVLASTYGAKKYDEGDDWNNLFSVAGKEKTYIDSALRHLIDYKDQDESNLPHLTHACWNIMAALEIFCRDKNINMKEYSENFLKNLNEG